MLLLRIDNWQRAQGTWFRLRFFCFEMVIGVKNQCKPKSQATGVVDVCVFFDKIINLADELLGFFWRKLR